MKFLNFKVILLVLVLIAISAIAIGCDDDATKAGVEQKLVFLIPGEASSLDPSFTNETYSAIVLNHMYEGLVGIDEEGNLVAKAAESFEITDQNTTFTFVLRDDLKWSDGQKITAHDYKNSWMRFIKPDTDNASMVSPYIVNVKEYLNGEVDIEEIGIRVLDDRTLQIKTINPAPFLVDILSHNQFFPVRFEAVDSDSENWSKNPDVALSNGPFVMSDYVSGEYVELKKNEFYWNSDEVKLETLRFVFRKDDSDVVSMYNNKEVDGLFEITTTELRKVPDSELETYTKILPSTAFLTFNHENVLMENPEFRKAISIAIDRQQVVQEVLIGAGIPTKYLVPFNYQLAGEAFRDYTELDEGVQIEEAKTIINKLIEEGVYDERPITFHYMINGPDASATERIIEQLKRDLQLDIIGIGMAWTELYEVSLNDDYDILMMGWGADYPHPMTFLSVFETGSFYAPITRWQDFEYEKMLNNFLLITDEAEGLLALRAIEEAILEEHHIAPVYYRKSISLMSQKVKNWYRPIKQFNFSKAWIEE